MITIGLLLGLFAGALIEPGAPAQSTLSGFDICAAAPTILARAEPDELRALADSAEAYRLKRRPDLHVKGALALYRLAQLNEDELLLKRALYFFDRAEHRYTEDACFFYYHGLVRRADGSVKPFASEAWARTVRGQNADQALRDFRKAHELRPDWLAPVAAIVQTATESFAGRIGRLSRWREQAFAALDRYDAAGGDNPEASLWRGRLLMDTDSPKSALASFLLCKSGAAIPVAEIETARALFALDRRAEATETYWRAVDSLADSAVAAEFGRDLHYIFDAQEAMEWPKLQPEARAAWVRRFWSRRAARDLVTVEERLAEHYRRLHHARTHYRRLTWGRGTVTSDLVRLPEEEILDDRGAVYVLLGKPDEDILCTIPGRSCRSWIYEMGDPRPIPLTFRTRKATDWYLVSTLPPEVYERLGSVDPYFYAYAWRMWLQSRDARGDLETAWAAPLRGAEASLRERRRAEREADVSLARDRQRLPIDYLLEFGYEWLFFQSDQPGQIEATLAYALPTDRLDCQAPDGTRTCRVEVRASIFGRDTMLAWEEMSGQVRLHPRSWLFGHLRLEAVPGTWEYRLALFKSADAAEEGRARGNWAGGAFTVPRLWEGAAPSPVSVSSLVLARPGAGDWVRGGEALALNPLHVYPPGATVELYYEIYGVAEGETYTTEIMLVPGVDPPTLTLDPSDEWVHDAVREGRAPLSLRFEESRAPAEGPWLVRRKTLALTDIEPGTYSLLLAITTAGGGSTVYRVTPLRVAGSTP